MDVEQTNGITYLTLSENDLVYAIVESNGSDFWYYRTTPSLAAAKLNAGSGAWVAGYLTQRSAFRSLLANTTRKARGYGQAEAKKSLGRKIAALRPTSSSTFALASEKENSELLNLFEKEVIVGTVEGANGFDYSNAVLSIASRTMGHPGFPGTQWHQCSLTPIASPAFLRSYIDVASSITIA